MRALSAIFVLIFSSASLFAQGRIVIHERPEIIRDGHVYLKSVNAAIELRQGVGNITLEQSFHNTSPAQLEGEYIFAIPDEAQVHDFHLYINGKKTQGEVLDSKEASEIYESIVRKYRDPALLEFAGHGLFKARIFPIAPKSERKIELSYAQVIKSESGTYRFTLPIRQSGQGSIEHYHMTIDLEAEAPLADVYSPSHKIEVSREGERKAKISFEANHLEGDRDFVLYYSLSDNEINSTLLTFRPRTDRDGYFMLLTTPRYEVRPVKTVAKDIIFVVDVSGSMGGEKIEQAREALRYCINTLKPEDRFEIISFSSTVENFRNSLGRAGKDDLENARYFVNNLSASGGTNIDSALQRALNMKNKDDGRPTSIIFLTDGLPTEGEKDVKGILQNVKNKKKGFVRVFSFGVGYDVNTFLLDKLSHDSHGTANYVRPGEDIEREVSGFFAKISSPVLTNPKIDFGGLRVYDVYPQQLPDIFQGQRVSVMGRYRSPASGEIRLTGEQSGEKREFEYQVTLDRRETENEFIAKLWANRKVSHLLMQIRFDGENQELVESIKNLGEQYGIITPYTSYLVREQERELAIIRNEARGDRPDAMALRIQSMQKARELLAEEDDEGAGSKVMYEALTTQAMPAAASSGRNAVMASRAMKKRAASETEVNMLLTVKRIADKTFNLRNGIWFESSLEGDRKPDEKIAFLSKVYFELSKKDAQIRRILALGERVVFEWQGKVYQIME